MDCVRYPPTLVVLTRASSGVYRFLRFTPLLSAPLVLSLVRESSVCSTTERFPQRELAWGSLLQGGRRASVDMLRAREEKRTMPTRSHLTFLHRKREQIQVLGDSAAQKHAYLLTMDIFRDPGREMIEHLVHHWRILKASSYSRSESRISGRRSPDSLEDTERGDERMGAFVA